MNKIEIGIIGGSGIYEIDDLADVSSIKITTPFGSPSDELITGTLNGKKIVFIARHGRNHSISPSEINNRANIYALKEAGVKYVISVSAVGSMKENIHPTDILIPDQLFDRTKNRVGTFFSDGIVAHISFDTPFCPNLSEILYNSAITIGCPAHKGGTYICIEGPQFSTKSESQIYRSWDVDVIGMTAIPEAKLAREAEMCYATLALVTDYDVWKEGEEVTASKVMENLNRNAENAKKIIKTALNSIPFERTCCCSTALQYAVQTKKTAVPLQTAQRLSLFLNKYTSETI